MHTQLYIDGQWVDGVGKLPVYDPSDGSVIAEVALAGDAQCDAAIAAADAAAKAWAKTAPRYRSEILRKAFELMTAENEAIATMISRENGKAMPDARGEATYAAEFFRWFAEETVRTPGDFRKSPSGDKRILVTHEPIGLSILITPWNFPAGMATRKIGPAVAAGCTMILKPAGETPLTALAIVDILERCGLPKGVLNVILPPQSGPAISKVLHDPRVKNLSFTGSTQVGKILLKEAADQVIRCSMELGGNAPFVVLDDANVEEAVKGLLMAKMRDLTNRVRSGRFRSSEMSDPTMTVTSLGDRGVEAVFPVIYPPQVAIIGFGTVIDEPVIHLCALATELDDGKAVGKAFMVFDPAVGQCQIGLEGRIDERAERADAETFQRFRQPRRGH